LIIDNIENLNKYFPLDVRLKKAYDYINILDKSIKPGNYEIDGKNMFSIVQHICTKHIDESAFFEAHRRYLDLQVILEG